MVSKLVLGEIHLLEIHIVFFGSELFEVDPFG